MSNDYIGSILIVARNTLALTKRAVASALSQTVPCDVLLINNASSDSTSFWARTKHITALNLLQQLSVAACWNMGIKSFWQAGRKECLVINNDVELPPDTYMLLRSTGIPLVTGVSVDTRPEPKHHPFASDLAMGMRPHPDFSAFMIHKNVTDQIGWFDEEYFPAYCEDASYHVKLWRGGVKAGSVDLPIYHERSSTLKHASPGERLKIQRGADSNRLKFKLKYGCSPYSPEYSELFTESSFGMDIRVTGKTEPH